MERLDDPQSKIQHLIDWESVHQRIASVGAALEEWGEASPEVRQRAWARRAAQLAAVPIQEDMGEQVTLVLIQVGREVYGLDVQYVFDIRPVEHITHVPRVPGWVAGVVNLRGHILSVVDLQRLFGLERDEQDGHAPNVVVVETPEMELALLADEVLAVESVPIHKIQDAGSAIQSPRPEYVQGIVERRGKDGAMLVVLNLPALLADQQLIVREEIN